MRAAKTKQEQAKKGLAHLGAAGDGALRHVQRRHDRVRAARGRVRLGKAATARPKAPRRLILVGRLVGMAQGLVLVAG